MYIHNIYSKENFVTSVESEEKAEFVSTGFFTKILMGKHQILSTDNDLIVISEWIERDQNENPA